MKDKTKLLKSCVWRAHIDDLAGTMSFTFRIDQKALKDLEGANEDQTAATSLAVC